MEMKNIIHRSNSSNNNSILIRTTSLEIINGATTTTTTTTVTNEVVGSTSSGIENLVFRGGGVKGLAYCGALSILLTLGLLKDVKRYAGSSAGAIMAALLCVGYTPHELAEMFKEHDFKLFKDADSLLNRAEKLVKSFGMYKGKYFREWLGKMIAEKTHNPDITFEEVFTTLQKEVVIVGTCISHMEVHYFSRYTTPDMSVRDAVRISMSIPLYFEPVILDDHVFIDGGVTDNFPLAVFDADGSDYANFIRAPVNSRTLGLFLVEDKTRQLHTRSVNSLKAFVGCLLDTVKQRIAYLSIKPGDEKRTIFIQTRYIRSTQFNIREEEKDLLFHEGQSAARKFFGLKLDPSADGMPRHDGRLIVKLIEGQNLKDNIMPDDPYCVFTLGNEVRTSSIKYKTLNPVWKEIFIFKVSDINSPLKVQVLDYEFLRKPVLLGSHEISVAHMPEGVTTDMWIQLTHGKIHLELTWSHSHSIA